MIVLPVHRWRLRKLKFAQMVVAILEELCHIHYSIDDEILVQYRVTDCFRNILPEVQRKDLYHENWIP